MSATLKKFALTLGGRRAFSLIEMLVTVALLSVIMIGLVVMFNQTRKAFTGSFTQVDVLQAGRSAADLISREVEEMAAGGSLNIVNFYVDSPVYNAGAAYLVQTNNSDFITNNLQQLFFIKRNNQVFTAVGYRLITSDYGVGIGSLYRYSVDAGTTNLGILTNQIPGLRVPVGAFLASSSAATNFIRLIDGVVDFRIRAFDVNGRPYGNIYNTNTGSGPYTNASQTAYVQVQTNALLSDLQFAKFTGAALPAYVEIELGILEDKALNQYRVLSSIPASAQPGGAAWNYLVNHLGQVHVFRQRISIRNANPAAYP